LTCIVSRFWAGERISPRLVDEYRVNDVIIAMPSAPGQVIRGIVEICKETKVSVKTLPGVYDLIDGKVSVSQLRGCAVGGTC